MDNEPTAAAARELLVEWLEGAGWSPRRITVITGDVSVRRYFRAELGGGAHAVAVFYPPQIREACAKFQRTSQLLERVGVRTPAILAADCDHGLMLLEDVGAATLYELAGPDWSELLGYYSTALDCIERIRSLPPGEVRALNPPLDRELLWQELEQTWRVFLSPEGVTDDQSFSRRLRAVLRALCARLGDETPVTCHRDFMARNLVPVSATLELVVLDHQDMRPGPPMYDLASLLNDSLFPPPEIEERLLGGGLSDEQRLSYHRAAVQRTLKAVGTFAAFSRRGDPRHRPLIAPTLRRTLQHLRRLPETGSLALDLEHRLRGALASDSRD